MNVQTYLFFDGRCEEALDFYRRALDAEVLYLMRYKEGPQSLIPPDGEEKVFHATMRIGETLMNLSDDLRGERGSFGGFALLVHLDSDEKAEQVFEALLSGGRMELAMDTTFWASRYGIVTDRFGVTWKVQSGG
jgi:PhnB protein